MPKVYQKWKSICLAQMAIFSLAIGGSGTKSLPLLSSNVGIMNTKGFLSVSSLEDEMEVAIS